ncbi:MAG TPA: sensor histidine kinase [Desulfobulbus sp.]|nr:sensor histidine kinase [Desulfobulbus sp.]
MFLKFRFFAFTLAVVLFGSCLVAIRTTGDWTRRLELKRIQEKAAKALKVYTGDLQSELDKFEALPQILATNPFFTNLLQHPKDKQLLNRVNQELERINRIAQTSAIYIIDAEGTVIASSNWRGAVSFIGEDLTFRPYFNEAIQGRPGRYFALGTTSHVRGYYFSAPVTRSSTPIGVLTVKVQLQRLEDIWARGSEKVIVTDPQGVIFITSYAPWKFRSLHPLSREVTEKLRKSRRYGDIEPDALTGTAISMTGNDSTLLELKNDAVAPQDRKTKGRHPYLIQSKAMPTAGWTVHILSDLSHIDNYVRNMMLLMAVFLAALFLLGMLLYNRRKTRRERIVLEEHTRTMLQKANEQLEDKVRQRTRELTQTNSRLYEEIEEHKQTEQELRATQNELIQAGKLAAIGQMAASITHEINQPLSAIRMYADNACLLLEQRQLDEARQNLSDIAVVITKMAEITKHLKSFARKSPGEVSPILLSEPINSALTLLNLRIKKYKVQVQANLPPTDIYVLAESIRLEQVLVNVIGNALDAVTPQEVKKITLDVFFDRQWVTITLYDSGSGIAAEHIDQLFDPFFTTKEEGRGLGLGLSLSQAIIHDFEGTIQAGNHPEGGTVVTITLQRTTSGKDD